MKRPIIGLCIAALVAGTTLATTHVLTASAAPSAQKAQAAPAAPGLAGVTFSGQSGPGVPSPTITVTGSGFGTMPTGTDNSTTSCGNYTNNGEVYANHLYFQANANFQAGYSTSHGANCIGIIIVSWSSHQVVLKFGSAYGTFDHWYLNNGDGYAISIKSTLWGGVVSGLS